MTATKRFCVCAAFAAAANVGLVSTGCTAVGAVPTARAGKIESPPRVHFLWGVYDHIFNSETVWRAFFDARGGQVSTSGRRRSATPPRLWTSYMHCNFVSPSLQKELDAAAAATERKRKRAARKAERAMVRREQVRRELQALQAANKGDAWGTIASAADPTMQVLSSDGDPSSVSVSEGERMVQDEEDEADVDLELLQAETDEALAAAVREIEEATGNVDVGSKIQRLLGEHLAGIDMKKMGGLGISQRVQAAFSDWRDRRNAVVRDGVKRSRPRRATTPALAGPQDPAFYDQDFVQHQRDFFRDPETWRRMPLGGAEAADADAKVLAALRALRDRMEPGPGRGSAWSKRVRERERAGREPEGVGFGSQGPGGSCVLPGQPGLGLVEDGRGANTNILGLRTAVVKYVPSSWANSLPAKHAMARAALHGTLAAQTWAVEVDPVFESAANATSHRRGQMVSLALQGLVEDPLVPGRWHYPPSTDPRDQFIFMSHNHFPLKPFAEVYAVLTGQTIANTNFVGPSDGGHTFAGAAVGSSQFCLASLSQSIEVRFEFATTYVDYVLPKSESWPSLNQVHLKRILRAWDESTQQREDSQAASDRWLRTASDKEKSAAGGAIANAAPRFAGWQYWQGAEQGRIQLHSTAAHEDIPEGDRVYKPAPGWPGAPDEFWFLWAVMGPVRAGDGMPGLLADEHNRTRHTLAQNHSGLMLPRADPPVHLPVSEHFPANGGMRVPVSGPRTKEAKRKPTVVDVLELPPTQPNRTEVLLKLQADDKRALVAAFKRANVVPFCNTLVYWWNPPVCEHAMDRRDGGSTTTALTNRTNPANDCVQNYFDLADYDAQPQGSKESASSGNADARIRRPQRVEANVLAEALHDSKGGTAGMETWSAVPAVFEAAHMLSSSSSDASPAGVAPLRALRESSFLFMRKFKETDSAMNLESHFPRFVAAETWNVKAHSGATVDGVERFWDAVESELLGDKSPPAEQDPDAESQKQETDHKNAPPRVHADQESVFG